MFKNYKKDRCYIIAEIGGNFINFEQAKRLIDDAHSCGVDAVKIQTFKAETITSKKVKFNLDNIKEVSQYEYFREYEIDIELHKKIFNYIDSKGLDWFSTPSHESDVAMLEEFDVGAYKIGSDDATNLPFLKKVAQTKKPVILSTGLCTLEEVKEAVNAILETGNSSIIVLHTASNYPTYPEEVNLLVIKTLKDTFPYLEIGFSDHTIGTTAAVCAAVMGARVIEKHFTYDKNAEGPDHSISATPEEMKKIVNTIREFEVMRGDGVKRPVGKEIINRLNNRKSIILIKPLKKGDIITEEHIAIKRPGTGIAPKYFEQVLGKMANRDMEADDELRWSDIRW